MGLDMMCNTIQKSVAMICRTKDHFPDLYLSGQVLNVCTTVKYLGHIINNEMSDDDDTGASQWIRMSWKSYFKKSETFIYFRFIACKVKHFKSFFCFNFDD